MYHSTYLLVLLFLVHPRVDRARHGLDWAGSTSAGNQRLVLVGQPGGVVQTPSLHRRPDWQIPPCPETYVVDRSAARRPIIAARSSCQPSCVQFVPLSDQAATPSRANQHGAFPSAWLAICMYNYMSVSITMYIVNHSLYNCPTSLIHYRHALSDLFGPFRFLRSFLSSRSCPPFLFSRPPYLFCSLLPSLLPHNGRLQNVAHPWRRPDVSPPR